VPIGSIIGGIVGQQGAQAGGDMAYGGAVQSAQMQQQEAQRGRIALSPWSGAGQSALGQIVKLLGLGELSNATSNDGKYYVDGSNAKELQKNAFADFQTDPGYNWRKQEGINALDRSAASRGMRLSGAQVKGVQNFGDGLASEEYNNYFNRLSGVSGAGQSATQSANGTSAGLVAGAGNAMLQGSAARGSGYAQGAAAMASGIGKATENAMSLAQMFGMFSDEREKTDIKKLGKDPETGLTLYAYRYKGDPKSYPKVVGPMAQDIEKDDPDAVREVGGKKIVNAFAMMGGR
jgi:hypothetical protein